MVGAIHAQFHACHLVRCQVLDESQKFYRLLQLLGEWHEHGAADVANASYDVVPGQSQELRGGLQELSGLCQLISLSQHEPWFYHEQLEENGCQKRFSLSGTVFRSSERGGPGMPNAGMLRDSNCFALFPFPPPLRSQSL